MSVQLTQTPPAYVFAGNPVVLGFTSDSAADFDFSITVQGHTPEYFTLSPLGSGASYKASIPIGDYLKTFFEKYTVETNRVIETLQKFSIEYYIHISEELVFTGTAFRGGVSEHVFAMLADEGLDMFTYRLADTGSQYLFTNRSYSAVIKIRESELYPIPFIHPGGVVSFRSAAANIISADTFAIGTICTMDFAEVKKRFRDEFGEDTKSVSVITESAEFTVSIESSQPSEERYLIRFLNSIGAYEVIEVTGKAYKDPQAEEENTWLTPDRYSFLEESRDRVSLRNQIEVSTGYKLPSEFPFLLDMITSDEAYLILPDGKEMRCNVTCEEMKHRYRITAPTSLILSVRFVNEEKYASHTPDLSFFVLAAENGSELITETNDQNITVKK